jgi:hypothetical protein
MKSRLFKTISAFLLAALCCTPALATPPPLEPLNGKYTYQVRWNGIGIGRVYITFAEDTRRYAVTVDTKTRGIVDFFAPLRSLITANGRINPAGEYIPSIYHSQSHSGRGSRKVMLRYTTGGALKERQREPMDDPNWRPEVPLEMLEGLADPLTNFLRFRKAFYVDIHEKKEEGVVLLYDGRRLAELRIKAIQPTRREIDGTMRNALNTVAARTPVAGYTPKELAKWEKGDPTIHVYFGLDRVFLPMEIAAHLRFGSITATLQPAETATKNTPSL